MKNLKKFWCLLLVTCIVCTFFGSLANVMAVENAELAKIGNYTDVSAATEYNLAVINNISWQVKADGLGKFNGDAAYNGDFFCTDAVEAKATVTFYGSVFGVVVQRGGWKVTIDGNEAANIEDSEDGYRVAYFTDKLSNAVHTAVVEITTVGADWPKLDAFLVDADVSQEMVKLPADVLALTNIKVIDGDDSLVICNNLATNEDDAHINNNAKFHGNSGGSLTLEFEGTAVGFVCQKGAFDIYIDDTFVETVWKKSIPGTLQLAYYNDNLSSGTHTISVVVNAETASEKNGDNYCVLECFVVQAEIEPEPTETPVPSTEPTETTAPSTEPAETPAASATDTPPENNPSSGDGFSVVWLCAAVVCAVILTITLRRKAARK